METTPQPRQKNKTLLIWDGPERPHKRQDRKFYTSMISLIFVIVLILGFAGQFMIILLILSLIFATYALYSTPPGKTTFVLTSEGIEFKDEIVHWNNIEYYFISKQLDETIINLDLKTGSLLKRRYLIPDKPETLEKAVKIIDDYVARKSPKTEEKGRITKLLDKFGLSLRDEEE